MPTRPLPENPDLDHLRGQARALQRAVRAGDPAAVERMRRQRVDATSHTLHAAQLAVAREYGFASWPRLKRYLDVVRDHGWYGTQPPTAPADEFCALACLTYDDDDPARWARARQLRAERPDLTGSSIWAAAAATEPATVARLLAADPSLARARGGPQRWRPLFHLAYSRVDPDVPVDDVRAVARLLLDAGADPNEGYLWRGLPTPFTVLTGAFGEGEGGPVRQPRHPHALELARLLLDAGADPNDAQALYNRMFGTDDDHLVLLFGYGLGRGDGGVWRARVGLELLDAPADQLRELLGWAVDHDQVERVRLLLAHGVDADPAVLVRAELSGHAEIAAMLRSAGATAPGLSPVEALVAAAFRADRAAVARLRARHPTVVDEARRARPGLVVWAAARGRPDTVALLVELGFDVNAYGRTDAPVEQPWETALHHAAGNGDLALTRLLLSLGADPDLRDTRFDGTPLDWARHFERPATADLLSAP
jgi:hypothetical protein